MSIKLRVFLSLCVVAVVAYAWNATPIAQNRQIGINVDCDANFRPGRPY